MPEFYVIIVRKIFFPNFRGARAPLPPLFPQSPTPMECSKVFIFGDKMYAMHAK